MVVVICCLVVDWFWVASLCWVKAVVVGWLVMFAIWFCWIVVLIWGLRGVLFLVYCIVSCGLASMLIGG